MYHECFTHIVIRQTAEARHRGTSHSTLIYCICYSCLVCVFYTRLYCCCRKWILMLLQLDLSCMCNSSTHSNTQANLYARYVYVHVHKLNTMSIRSVVQLIVHISIIGKGKLEVLFYGSIINLVASVFTLLCYCAPYRKSTDLNWFSLLQ